MCFLFNSFYRHELIQKVYTSFYDVICMNLRYILILGISFLFMGTAFIQGIGGGDSSSFASGFSGVSWKNVAPVNKVTFVQFDEENYVDDYAYMAAIPSAIFYDEKNDILYSHPLLYYNEVNISDKKELSLNSSQGIKYFMEDWTAYCGDLQEMVLINARINKKWNAEHVTFINGTTPWEIAKEIAVKNWISSENAVITYSDVSFPEKEKVKGEINGSIPAGNYKTISIKIPEPEGIGGIYKSFEVEEPYIYITAEMKWNPLLRGKDLDLQLYDDQLGMVDASENWNALSGTYEKVESYVFHHGTWEIGVTNMPTEDIGKMEKLTAGLFKKGREYEVNVKLYPGRVFEIPDKPSFGCKNVTITLSWDGNAQLGMILKGPSGVAFSPVTGEKEQKMHLDQLGVCDEDSYSLCIFSLENTSSPTNFEVKYEWEEMPPEHGDSLTSSAEGAILASLLNAPLLYVNSSLPKETKDAITSLHVKNLVVVDIGNHISSQVIEELQKLANIEEFFDLRSIYQRIMGVTHQHDVIFSTTDPWTYWLAEELKPAGEKKGALYVGPAAYMAAHHGVPLLIVDEHPPLSRSSAWVTEFWKEDSRAREPPSVGCMYIMGNQVYDFLNDYGFDKEGKENILTIAGQFDIGIGWDRAFVGKANPGRILGTPVDTAYWICRSVFYPAMIFVNPALSPEGIELINGSSSTRDASGRFHIIKPSQKEHFTYPALNTWVSYCHNFNRDASKYWGCTYTCRDGITPYLTPSPNPIDEGVTDKIGAYWPDMSTSEVVPFYLKKLGYENAFSTNFTATMSNLNKGVILWFEGMHASHISSGVVGFWDPNANWTKMFYLLEDIPFIGKIIKNKKINVEPNPWRAYEFGLWRQAFFRWGLLNKDTQIFQTGCTEKPDVMVMDKWIGWDWRSGLHPDGIVIAILQQVATEIKTGYEIDEALENLHSCGINAGISCFISSTYLHLTLIRHGSVFQIIDPWLTSWYCNFAVEMFSRYLALGYTAGEAYEASMSHVGIEYLTGKWWWDICENVCYFGDPELRIWSPSYGWEMPEMVDAGEIINGHCL